MPSLVPAPPTSPTRQLVGFSVAGVSYAMEIHRVREIIQPLALVKLPHLPPCVLGVADHRGDVMPVVDLRERFGVASRVHDHRNRWFVVGQNQRHVALIVDAVSDVFTVTDEDRRAFPGIGANAKTRAISEAYSVAGSLVFVVDVDLLTDVAMDIDMTALRQLVEGTDT